MAKVIEKLGESKGTPVVICDFSPPRGANPSLLDGARLLDADFLCVAYSPGKSVRVEPAIAAYMIQQEMGKDVLFTVAARDMNRLAVQTHLLGASLLGLDNVVVVSGDPFTERELASVKNVSDFTSAELIESVKSMNRGVDYRELKLRSPTDFCVGATIDMGRGTDMEAMLTRRKALAGADFFITQPLYQLEHVQRFHELYESLAGERLSRPVFVGVQIPDARGLTFGTVPDRVKSDLANGREGTDIAIETMLHFIEGGISSLYLVPPIFRNGLRDYKAAQTVIEAVRGM